MECLIRSIRAVIAVVGVLAVSACGGSTEPRAGIASVSVSPSAITLLKGVQQQVLAIASGDGGTPVAGSSFNWTTSAPNVATVSPTGVVLAVGSGSARITATLDGKSGSTDVSVVTVALASVATGGAHSCGLTSAGAAWCWGRSEAGQLGVAPPSDICLTVETRVFTCIRYPVPVQGGLSFTKIAGADGSTCALTSDGSAFCWGSNNSGQLGDNSTGNTVNAFRAAPGAVLTSEKFVSLTAGAFHVCGLTAAGAAYCWGSNGKGQLGDGTQTSRSVPVAVVGGHAFRMISGGQLGTCGVTTTDDAYCWGENSQGQIGTGTKDNGPHPLPVLVSGNLKWTQLDAGFGSHVCGITVGGAAYCWGENSYGALGDGTTTQRLAPARVSGGITFAHVTAGGFTGHSCGLNRAGKAYCWGDNEVGAVGDGTSIDRLSPVAVAGDHTFSSLDSGLRHTCGRASTGIVYCWGSGRTGQIGSAVSGASFREPTPVVGQP